MKINLMSRRFAFFCLIYVILHSTANAQAKPQRVEDLTRPVRENSSVTYAELIKLVISEKPSGERETVPLDHLFGDYQKETYRGKFQVGSVQSISFNRNGHKETVLLIKLSDEAGKGLFVWQELTILALFEIGDASRLIAAIDVQADRFTFFSEAQPMLKISALDDALLIVNHHFNAGESYTILSLVGVVGNRFAAILDDVSLMTTMTAAGDCDSEDEETALLTLGKLSRNTRRNITINYTRRRLTGGAQCGLKIKNSTKIVRTRYSWNVRTQKYLKVKTNR